jgi:hypothetical protein
MRLPLVGFANGKIEYNSSPLFYQAVQTIAEVEERPLHLVGVLGFALLNPTYRSILLLTKCYLKLPSS